MAAQAQRLLLNLRNLLKVGVGVASAGGGIVVFNAAYYSVDAGQRAVIFDRFQGRASGRVVAEGTHFHIPWVQKPIIFNIRSTPRNFTIVANTKDLQPLQITVEVSSRPELRMLPEIYNNYGIDYDERVLPTLATNVLETVVAECDVADFSKNAKNIRQRILKDLSQRADSFGIIVENVSLTDLRFPLRPNIR